MTEGSAEALNPRDTAPKINDAASVARALRTAEEVTEKDAMAIRRIDCMGCPQSVSHKFQSITHYLEIYRAHCISGKIPNPNGKPLQTIGYILKNMGFSSTFCASHHTC